MSPRGLSHVFFPGVPSLCLLSSCSCVMSRIINTLPEILPLVRSGEEAVAWHSERSRPLPGYRARSPWVGGL